MKLTQIKGNTWVLEGYELIPLYKTDETHCVLLDTGVREEREDIEAALLAAGLTPAGILGSHVHTDHSANHRYFQEKYHIPVALPVGEAGLCRSILNLKSQLFVLSPGGTRTVAEDLVVEADVTVGEADGPVEFCGAVFQILHTPGHSPDHISIITPDDVCYLGDAMVSGDGQEYRVPCNLSHQVAMESREKLRNLTCQAYVLAHRGVYDRIDALIDLNQELILDRAAQIATLVRESMTLDEIYAAACRHFDLLSSKVERANVYEYNLRPFVEFLQDRGDLVVTARGGVRYYGPKSAE